MGVEAYDLLRTLRGAQEGAHLIVRGALEFPHAEVRALASLEALDEAAYSFTHLALAFDDFTQASMKAMPSTPSLMPG